jgi:predicted SnoaL-like aldol condensation-catalyzing enzyme/ketosteroid isomerase-like protein
MKEDAVSQVSSPVERFYACLAAGDRAGALGLLDPGIEWTEAESTPYFRGTLRGVDAIVSGLFGPLAHDFTAFAAMPHEFVHDGNRVVVFGRYSGVAKNFERALSAPFVHSWTLADGRLRRFVQYTDSAAWNEALLGPSISAEKLGQNKQTAVAFYRKAVFEGDVDTAVRLYGGTSYTQHTPFAADGFEGLREYVKWIVANYPHTRGEIRRVFADGDFVLLHCHWTGFFGKNGDAIVDIFRVAAGKVVEHWDVIQAIPDTSLNANTMF